jgi:hypothetical protein
VRISEKETVATVWIHVPGYRLPPGLDEQPPPADPSGHEDAIPDPDRRSRAAQPQVSTEPPAEPPEPVERSAAGAVFHVHAERDAYAAQQMTVTHYEGTDQPGATP